jgi:beta-galactosidase/beta-glucuronidase
MAMVNDMSKNRFSSAFALSILGFWLAANTAFAATNQIQYLSGTDKDHTVPWEFRVSAGRNSGFWTNIPVPSCWDTKGFGSYEYGNDTTSEFGEYRHAFTVPASWVTQRVFLVFEGAMTDTEVRINGQLPGRSTTSQPPALHQGGFYEFGYEVTDNLQYGASNLLEVTVRKKSANTSINQAERQADYWTFGGIYRPVYLEARPPAHIERVAVDAKADGQIAVHTFLSGVSNASTVVARVTDAHGQPLGSEFTTRRLSAGASNVILATATLPAPRLWSPEFPHLYKLTIQLRDGANLVHSRTETIGFRTITFTNSVGFFLNGKKIMLRGVNRHDFWPDSGRTTSRAVSIADIELMKSMNLNAVRMSHYPPAKHFLEECDRLGLLVLDELAGWQAPPYDNNIAPQLVRELVVRDVNHPCIFAWANGNEGGSNPTVDDDFGLWDPQIATYCIRRTGNPKSPAACARITTRPTVRSRIISARASRFICPRKSSTASTMAAPARAWRIIGTPCVPRPTAAACSSGRCSTRDWCAMTKIGQD